MSCWHVSSFRITGALICLLLLGVSTARAELIPAEEGYTTSLCGYVYCDINNNGLIDTKEVRIAGVTITLDGTEDGTDTKVTLTTLTDQWGFYVFGSETPLVPGTYSILEQGPKEYVDGKDWDPRTGALSPYDDEFRAVQVGVAETPPGIYNFGEWGLKTKYISKRTLLKHYPPPPPPVAEPTTFVLLAIGGAVLLCSIAKRRYW